MERWMLPRAKVRIKKGLVSTWFADSDRDGVANIFDCKPNNRRRQGKLFRADIRKNVMAPPNIVYTVHGKRMVSNYPSKKEVIDYIKETKQYGKSVPPEKRVLVISEKDVVRQLEKNPDLYHKFKRFGAKIEMKNTWDAVHSDNDNIPVSIKGKLLLLPGMTRSLATYRPAYRLVQVNPILDKERPNTLLPTLKHEAVHIEQDSEGKIFDMGELKSEREAYRKQEEPTARQLARRAGPQPQALQNLPKQKRTVKESDFEKERRIRAGYTKIRTINPEEFVSKWEQTHGKRMEQDFAWNEQRLKSALDRESDDSYPRITRSGDVEDGRHRIAAAKERGEMIDVVEQVEPSEEEHYTSEDIKD
jgi:hypothetical protein